MTWDLLPDDIINIILYYRKRITCGDNVATKIQSVWKSYKIRVLINRYKTLRYLPIFKKFNPNIYIFISRSRL